MYDPTIGQFLSEDPWGFDAGDTNLRRYVGNSPLNFVDPTGFQREIVGLEGVEIPEAGGQVPGTDIVIRAYQKVTVGGRENGVLGPGRETGLYQFSANSAHCPDLHWIQFYKESQWTSTGALVPGYTHSDDSLRQREKWHLDAPSHVGPAAPAPGYPYYDNPLHDNLVNRTPNQLNIFDRPSQGSVDPNVDSGGHVVVLFKTYLVTKDRPLWEITWKLQGAVKIENGEAVLADGFQLMEMNGAFVDRFDPALNTANWSVGNPIDDLGRAATNTSFIVNPYGVK